MSDNRKMMSVILTLKNGERYVFSGPAFPDSLENIEIVDIKFTKPADLPEGTDFIPMEEFLKLESEKIE